MVPSRPSALNYYFHAYVKIFVGGIRGREREFQFVPPWSPAGQ